MFFISVCSSDWIACLLSISSFNFLLSSSLVDWLFNYSKWLISFLHVSRFCSNALILCRYSKLRISALFFRFFYFPIMFSLMLSILSLHSSSLVTLSSESFFNVRFSMSRLNFIYRLLSFAVLFFANSFCAFLESLHVSLMSVTLLLMQFLISFYCCFLSFNASCTWKRLFSIQLIFFSLPDKFLFSFKISLFFVFSINLYEFSFELIRDVNSLFIFFNSFSSLTRLVYFSLFTVIRSDIFLLLFSLELLIILLTIFLLNSELFLLLVTLVFLFS